MLKKVSVAAALALATLATSASAAVIVPPEGYLNKFEWYDGVGPIDAIYNYQGTINLNSTEWSLTSTINGTYTIWAWDDFNAGDAFGLVLDGVATAWQTFGFDGNGYFYGNYILNVVAGTTYTIGLDVTQLAPGYNMGGAYASIKPHSVTVPQVPLPAAAPLLLAALGGLVALRRRKSA